TSTHQTEAVPTFLSALISHAELRCQIHQRIDQALGEGRQAMAGSRAELADLDTRLGELRPFVEAKRRGAWWKPAWWQATFRGNALARWSELEDRRQQTEAAVLRLRDQMDGLARERQQAEDDYQRERGRALSNEIERRRGELDAQQAALLVEATKLQHAW